MRHLSSLGLDPTGTLALQKLEQAILEGADVGRHCLRVYEEVAAAGSGRSTDLACKQPRR